MYQKIVGQQPFPSRIACVYILVSHNCSIYSIQTGLGIKFLTGISAGVSDLPYFFTFFRPAVGASGLLKLFPKIVCAAVYL